MTVEMDENGDSKSTNERGPSLVGSWACRVSAGDFCPALAALVGPVKNFLFFAVHYFNSFVPIAQQSGQAVVLNRLSLNTSLCASTLILLTYFLNHIISIFSPISLIKCGV
jgi:hypothetical protein